MAAADITPAFLSAPIEVRDVESTAYYTAQLLGVQEQFFHVRYESSVKGEELVESQRIRLAESRPERFLPRMYEIVEACALDLKNGVPAWWRANVTSAPTKPAKGGKMMIGIQYPDIDQMTDTVDVQFIRPLNRNPVLTQDHFNFVNIILPKELNEQELKVSDYDTVRKTSNVLLLTLDQANRTLTLYGDTRSLEKAKVICQHTFAQQRQLQYLKKRSLDHEEYLKKLQNKKCNGMLVEFKTTRDLMGYVIGKKGENILKAERLPGVEKVRVDANHTVSIMAETPEAAAAARRMLEFVDVLHPIPAHQVDRILGQRLRHLRNIQRGSEVLRLDVVRKDSKQVNDAPGEELQTESTKQKTEEKTEKEKTGKMGKAEGTKDQRRRRAEAEKKKKGGRASERRRRERESGTEEKGKEEEQEMGRRARRPRCPRCTKCTRCTT